jgi:Phage integrase family
VLSCTGDSDKYTDVRDRAMLAVYAASGLRFSEVLFLELDQLDRYTGWIKTTGKGNRERVVRLGERALKELRACLRARRAKDGVIALFTTDEGTPSRTLVGSRSSAGSRIRLTSTTCMPIVSVIRGLKPHWTRVPNAPWCRTRWAGGATRWSSGTAVGWPQGTLPRRCRPSRRSRCPKILGLEGSGDFGREFGSKEILVVKRSPQSRHDLNGAPGGI